MNRETKAEERQGNSMMHIMGEFCGEGSPGNGTPFCERFDKRPQGKNERDAARLERKQEHMQERMGGERARSPPRDEEERISGAKQRREESNPPVVHLRFRVG